MFYKRILFATCATIAGFTTAKAQTSAPKYSNEFLAIGVGARAMGMGNVQVSTVKDVTAGYWNPAGLVSIQSNIQVGLMHSEYFAGIAKYDYASIAAPIDATSTVGITFIRLAVDDIPDTSELIEKDGSINYDRIKSFSAADYAFMFHYARKNKDIEGLSYGGSAKVIYRNVGQFAKAWGFGLDAGAQYERGNFLFGLMLRDITSTFNAWSFNVESLKEVYALTNNALPQNGLEITLPKSVLSTGYKKTFFGEKLSLLGAIDLDLSYDGRRNTVFSTRAVSGDPHVGLEIGFLDMIFLRAGVMNIQQTKDFDSKKSWTYQPNLGAGIHFKQLQLDYAFANLTYGSGANGLYSNVISLKLDIYRQEHNKTRRL